MVIIKPFLTSTFAFIYQFMIQKAFKFIVKYIFGWNLSTKVFLDGHSATTNSLPYHPPFFSAYKRSLLEAYQWLGTETSPVIGLNYLIYWYGPNLVEIGSISLFFTFFCDFPTNSSDIHDTGRKWVNCFRVVSLRSSESPEHILR